MSFSRYSNLPSLYNTYHAIQLINHRSLTFQDLKVNLFKTPVKISTSFDCKIGFVVLWICRTHLKNIVVMIYRRFSLGNWRVGLLGTKPRSRRRGTNQTWVLAHQTVRADNKYPLKRQIHFQQDSNIALLNKYNISRWLWSLCNNVTNCIYLVETQHWIPFLTVQQVQHQT